jgi:nitronate monooxygenase
MALPEALRGRLRLPVIGAPLFVISTPDLVLAQCKAGIVGAFPALNARPASQLDEWLQQIQEGLHAWDQAHPETPSAPFAVNQIVHKSNDRLEEDLALCVKHKVPVVVSSLGAQEAVNRSVHSYGGLILHDVTNNRFAQKAIEKGADGLIAVAAGAGGHAGTLSPFALMQEIREWFAGPVALSGSIAKGGSILAALACGADLAYIGSAFIATKEANAAEAYKAMIVESSAEDIVYTNLFTRVHGNYLKGSILKAGLDPAKLPESDPSKMNFASGGNMEAKAWRDIWGCGQGVGAIHDVPSVAELVARFGFEFDEARKRLGEKLRPFSPSALPDPQ